MTDEKLEKEAEEYVIKKHNIDITKQPIDFSLRCEFSEDLTDFQKGAKVGYNKAKEEADKMKSQFLELCNLKDMRIAELEKANEWHKPSEKLPEECSLVLAYLFEETEPTICEYVVSNQWECLPKRIVFCSNDQVRKWKEIVLPKEEE